MAVRVARKVRVKSTEVGLEVPGVGPDINRTQVNIRSKAGHIKEVEPQITVDHILGDQPSETMESGVGEQQRLKPLLKRHLLQLLIMAWGRLPGFPNLLVAGRWGQSWEQCHSRDADVRKRDICLLDDPRRGGIRSSNLVYVCHAHGIILNIKKYKITFLPSRGFSWVEKTEHVHSKIKHSGKEMCWRSQR